LPAKNKKGGVFESEVGEELELKLERGVECESESERGREEEEGS